MPESDAHSLPIEEIGDRLTTFFPDTPYSRESVSEGLEVGDFLYQPGDILLFLQTALLDEKMVELEFDNFSRVFFTRLIDNPPPPGDEEGEEPSDGPDYQLGDYLKDFTSLLTLPVEPGIGNFHIRHSSRVILRFFTSSYAVEVGVTFQKPAVVDDLMVLHFTYPGICRVVRGAREYRAKVPADMELFVEVAGKRKQPAIIRQISDISAKGMSFSLEKEQQDFFVADESRSLDISLDGQSVARLSAKVRHVSKVRRDKGIEYICGVQFDLATRSLAGQVEQLVAKVQRAHLQELSDLSDKSGISLAT